MLPKLATCFLTMTHPFTFLLHLSMVIRWITLNVEYLLSHNSCYSSLFLLNVKLRVKLGL